MAHANAALTPRARLKLARLIVENECPVAQAAVRFQVSWPTAKRWADRYLELGEAGMADRSSRPHRMPRLTRHRAAHDRAPALEAAPGQLEIAARLGLAASTVHRVLVRCGISRLNQIDRATGEPVRRYEHPYPGSMIHVDVKKLGTSLTRADGATSADPGQPQPSRDPRRAPQPPPHPAWAPPTSIP